MKTWLLVVLVAVVTLPADAQDIGPEAAVLGKGLFGYNGLISLDVSTPMEYSYNPAVISVALGLFGKCYGELDYGKYDFSDGPDIETTWAYTAFLTGKDQAVRIGCYGTSSDPAETKALGEDIAVDLSTETVELAYARRVKPGFYAGISISPETADTIIEAEGFTLAKGKAKSDINYRIGTFWTPNNQLALGATYAYDGFGAEMRFFDPETGVLAGKAKGEYQEKLLTVGVTYNLTRGTFLAISHQGGKLEGPGINEDVDLMAYSLTQYLNPMTNVAVSYSDYGWTYTAQYRDKNWCFGTTIGTGVYQRANEFLGSANSFYVWAGRSW